MKNFFLLISFLGIQFTLLSQNRDDYFKVPTKPASDQPDWAQMMYGDDPNAYEVDKLFEKYYRTREYKKTLHGQNYKFWRKAIEPYLNEEGKIRAPSQKEEELEFQRVLENKNNSNAESSTANWISIGPFETYKSGTLTPNSNQVNVYSIDQSLSHPDILYCGTESSGAFKTTNKGLNWTLISANEVFVGGLSAIKIHPTDPDNVFLTGNNRIYQTTDGGTTWTEKHYIGSTGNEIKFHPTKPDTIFVTTSNGLYTSENGGTTWSQIYSDGCWDIDFHPTNPDTVYLLKRNNTLKREEFFMSSDEGQTWTLKDMGWYSPAVLAEAGMNGGKIAVSPVNTNKIWVCLIGASKANDNGWIGVYRSTDRGDNWTNLAGQDGGPYAAINDPTNMWNVAAYSSGYHQGYYNFDCEASHNNEDVIWIGTIRLTESANGGMTFEGIGAANSNRLSDVHADIQDIEVIGNDIWVASDGGINYSNDELMSHSSRKKGITGSNFWGFGSGWNEDVLVGGRYHNGNHGYYQTYGVGNGHKIGGVEEATGYVNPIDARQTYFSQGWSGHTKHRKIPAVLGNDYSTLSNVNILPNEHYIESYSSRLYFDYRYANHIYTGSGSKFWKSTDAGVTFMELHDFGTDGRVLEIEQSRDNYNVFYLVFKPNGTNARDIYRSSDGGNNWTLKTAVPTNNRNKLEITTNPKDENEIWVCANDASNGNEVYKSLDGGTTWTNMTTSTLDGEHMTDIYYQGGTNDVVYLMSRTKIWYYDTGTNDWVDYSTGLPLYLQPLQMRPFYRDNKLRYAGSRGIYESPLAVTGDPIAQPMTEKDSVFCSRDTIQFECYSMMAHTGASWEWTFTPAPQYVSSLTARNPKVVFGANGDYDVSLKVTDGSGNMDTRAISKMVTVESHCEVDTIPDNALRNFNHGDYMVVSGADLENITHFTTTAWIKADSSLSGFSGIVTSGDWCAHCDYTEGLIVDYWGSRLWYKWDGTANTWASNSGMYIPLGEWAFVGLVVYPDSAIMYLNDQRYVKVAPHNPGNIQNLHVGYGHYSKSFRGDIDEVTVWNRALTQDEIRELRHITKQNVIPTDPNLIAYFQFSEIFNGQVMDHAGSYHGSLNNGSVLAPSTAPIGGGVSQRITLSQNTYEYDFNDLDAKLYFSDCEYPSGEIVLTRINLPPDTLPNGNAHSDSYWILNGYDGASSFEHLDSIKITPEKSDFVTGLSAANDAILFARNKPNEHLNNWTPKARAKSLSGNEITYHRGTQLSMPSQFVLTNNGATFIETDPGKHCIIDTIPGNVLKVTGNSTSYAETAHTENLNFGNGQDFSVSFWVKTTDPTGDGAIIAKKDWDSGANKGWIIAMESGELWMNAGDGSNRFDIRPNQIMNDGKWHHIAGTFDQDGDAKLYLDGVEIGSASMTGLGDIEEPTILTLGADDEYDYPTEAEIDEVAIFNKVLTQAEIRENMHLITYPNTPNMVAYYQFNEPGGRAYNLFKGENHLTLSAAATREISTSPIGGGLSQSLTLSPLTYEYDFNNLNAKMYLSDCETPTGEIVLTRLHIAPDSLPNSNQNVEDYWIINGFDGSETFSILDSIEITPEKMDFADSLNSTNDAFLFTRNTPNEHLNNWSPKSRANSLSTNTFTYHRSSQISMPSQLFLTNGGDYFDEIDPGKNCEPDTIPGNSVKTLAQGDWVQTPHLGFTTDTFTISAWIKPTGFQSEYAGIFINDITTAGFNFRENNNTLGYHWLGGAWWWDSGLEAPPDEWSHVALVITPTSATVYLNGVGATNNRTLSPVFFEGTKIGSYKGWSGRNYVGELDEVCVWRRALSQGEIRELIHLTKEDVVGVDSTLHLYLQFNEESGEIADKSGNNFHSNLVGNAARTPSTAPVGGGESERMTVNSGGVKHFQNTGIKLDFPSSGTYPDGELVTYRINVPPDQKPTADTILNNGYWIIRNYGTNSTFSVLDNIEFENTTPISTLDESSPGQFALFKRNSNAFGNTWGSALANAKTVTAKGNQKGDVVFGSATNITEFSQFAITDSRGVKLTLKAFLQAAYSAPNMNDNLRNLNYLPLNEPYTNLNFNHKNGGGGETASANLFNILNDNAVTDWIFVELRDKNDNKNVLYSRAALLQRDGDIVDIDGSSGLNFSQAIPDDYYVAIRHRNHLGAMTLNTFSLSSTTTNIDFTSNATQIHGTNGLVNLGGNVMGLWQGDVNNDGEIRYNGKASDRVQTLLKIGFSNPNNILSGYHIFDVNMDGVVKYYGTNNDREAILLNLGASTPNNVLLGQLPK